MKKARLAVLMVGLALGVAGGLLYAWVLAPGASREAAPRTLAADEKMAYLLLVGDLYAGERDLARAKGRLAALDVPADGTDLAARLEQYLDEGSQPEQARNLARLAQDLGAAGGIVRLFGLPTPTPAAEPIAATGSAVQPTGSPSPAAVASAGPPPTARPVAHFRLVDQTATCGAAGLPGMMVVRVRDAQGNGLPGMEVTVSWGTGADRFFTGLRPERGPGYGDLQMSPGLVYDVSLAGVQSDVARGLPADVSPGLCPTTSLGLDWLLVFEQIKQEG